ncbi:hypothetical protein [Amycolatopsis sp. GM8]|uniref:hypothetical protein n=1 Tax=Amycolatopsis sp. GM8 TaxID=2896530 RepID=UPI001F239E6B|nr:hypothetical protein [Amycolatopsis sp. GM8]
MNDRTLAAQLGSLPEGIAALPEEDQQDLSDALHEARRRQARALAKAGNEALRFIPALLRPAVRRAMGLWMTSDAEIRKLARTLGVAPERFGYLREVPPEELRRLRAQVTSALYDAHLDVLERMAGASRLLPNSLLARIAERVFGPLLSARIAGLVDVTHGVDIAKRLSPGFLADVAAELDPRRAAGIIAGLPAPVVTKVAAELARREDWITIARFVDMLPRRTIMASVEVIPPDALARVAELLDDPARVHYVLPADRIDDDLAG